MDRKIRVIEAACIAGIVVLSAVIALGIGLLYAGGRVDEAELSATPTGMSLAAWSDHLPENLDYGRRLPVTVFRAADGSAYDLNDLAGRKLLLLFWGSWCPYCDAVLTQWETYASALAGHPDCELILINKLDASKGETIERAQAYLSEKGIPFECVYDENLTAWQACGVKRLPTLLVLDRQGYLRHMTADVPTSGPEVQALLDYAESGGAAATERFVTERMTGADGGVYTAYLDKRGASPAGHDVLCESQGLLMTYAVLTGDRPLFDRSWQFLRDRLQRDGIFAWYVTEDGQQADANALIDDLRVLRALNDANALWGGYEAELTTLREAIGARNIRDGLPVGFYDFRQKRAGSVLPLFCLDMEALGELGLRGQAEDILRGGYIGDDFPLYYASYDVSARRYSAESLNTSEALMTLWHAVRAGVAEQASVDWLERQVVAGTLAARYDAQGQVVKGFDYGSTAAYAIAALIGAEAGNARLYTCARRRMETYYVTEPSALQGSFSDRADGSDITAFDQLMPLLVYAGTGDIIFDD